MKRKEILVFKSHGVGKSECGYPCIPVEPVRQAQRLPAGLNFILTTGDANALNISADDRRYAVVRMPG